VVGDAPDIVVGTSDGASFGVDVAAAGDVNGDGVGDRGYCDAVDASADMDGDGLLDGVLTCSGEGTHIVSGAALGESSVHDAATSFVSTGGGDRQGYIPWAAVSSPDLTGDAAPDLVVAGSDYDGEMDNGVILVLAGPLPADIAREDAVASIVGIDPNGPGLRRGRVRGAHCRRPRAGRRGAGGGCPGSTPGRARPSRGTWMGTARRMSCGGWGWTWCAPERTR
jgi:hypothetical protein